MPEPTLPDGLIHVRDREGVEHLADDGPLGLAVGCDSWEWMTVCAPDPRGETCGDCLTYWSTP